jgi:hypothetical protein
MFKYLPLSSLKTLYTEHKLTFNYFNIFYIPKKFIKLQEGHHHYYFYDINNFLETSLNLASKNYLGKEKLKIINAKKLNTSLLYWKKHASQIIKYCLQDALLTKEVADFFWNTVYKTLNFQPKRPFSKGKLAEEYFLHKCYIPTINELPPAAIHLAWNNYSGGRFELLKRGFFEKVYIYDIKSAYPAIIATLPDFNIGKWEESQKYDKEADLSIHQCLITCYTENFSPFMEKVGTLNIYPNGKFYQTLNNHEIDFIRKNFPNQCKIEIKEGIKCHLIKELFPYKEEIEYLYNWKEREKDKDIKYCIKIIMNSYYGKKIQAINFKAGKLFNPIEASLITSLTRLKLLDLALQSPNNIISFSTDSIASKIKLEVPKNPKLGEFSFEFQGSGYYIMSDIYSLSNNKTRKDKFRGFNIIEEEKQETIKEYTIEYILQEMKSNNLDSFKYERVRPFHLGECLMHHKKRTIADINIFKPHIKTIKLNGDIKRIWDRPFKNAKDAMENQINSLPLHVY